jgi:chemotaxis protein CheZ
MDSTTSTSTAIPGSPPAVHHSIGLLTRQLHDALNGLGMTDKVKGLAGEIPDARSRLSYIARVTGEAAEKVLNRVDQAKAQQDHIAAETRRIGALIVKDPVAAVAKGHVMNFITDVEESTKQVDQHLTEIMMAQDFHDLTGQVIAKVVNLAANIEEQLVQLLIQTAPQEAAPAKPVAPAPAPVAPVAHQPVLAGPAINPQGDPDVVSGQSEVDDLLASLGF